MWTISNEQMERISQSMRVEFEKRVFYTLSKEKIADSMSEIGVKTIISNQVDRAIQYGFTNEEQTITFIRLCFEYPEIRLGNIQSHVDAILSEEGSMSNKMESLINYLKNKEDEQAI